MLLNKPNTVVNVPGSDQISRIVESTSKKDRPHLVTKGKAQGEFRWERNCPHFNGLKICSDSVVTAHCNGMLRDFMVFLENKKVNVNVSSTVRTDMPQMPGKKGGQVGRKRSLSQLSVDERVTRNYSPSIANVNSFYVKKMNSRIRIFQGCCGLLISEDGSIPGSPYNYSIARREQRPYFDKNTNTKKTPINETDSHYHLKKSCILNVEPSFSSKFLCIPEYIDLTHAHLTYIEIEFGLKSAT